MNPLRTILDTDRPAIGTWLSLGSPNVAEILARSGLDWLLIDAQHSAIGPAEVLDLVRTVAAGGASPVVRVASADGQLIGQALDSGAHGVMVPMVADPETAMRVVSVAAYPPKGERSIGGFRGQFGFALSRSDYLVSGGQPLIAIQIENREGLDRVDEILSVDGLDVCFVGPQDLAASLGLQPVLDSTEPTYAKALERIVRSAQDYQVRLGILTATNEGAERYRAMGFALIAISTDARVLAEAASALSTAATGRTAP
jgi:4-hydroxy-2-oxoheptanedioate aldolase